MSIEYVCLSKTYSEISCLHVLNFIPLPEVTQVTDLCAMNTIHGSTSLKSLFSYYKSRMNGIIMEVEQEISLLSLLHM